MNEAGLNAFVSWTKRTPECWKVKRLKYAVTLISEKMEPGTSGLPYIGLEHVESWTGRLVETAEGESSADGLSTRFRPNDVLFGKLRPYLAKVHRARQNGGCSGELLVLRPALLDSRYLSYFLLMDEFIAAVDASTYGSKMPRANWECIGNLPTFVPPLDEQRAIADFLDRETAKVDDLIAYKQDLIVLLQSHEEAVVREIVLGQALRVPKRYSGYSWLGDVPSHWKVLSLKRIATRVVVGIAEASTHAYSDDGVPLIRSANIRPNRLDSQQLLKIEPWFANKNKSKTVWGDDLLTVRSGVNYGDTAAVPNSLAGSQCFTLLVTSLKPGNVPQYFSYYLNSRINRAYFEQEAWGAAQANLSVPILQMTPVPVPPPGEQASIVHALDRRLREIERLRMSLEETERRLQLLRSALISAAVTGQIDVRNYRPREVAIACQ
jgi:type I restriction enzyme S subunit